MKNQDITKLVAETWLINNEIDLMLIKSIPVKGLAAVPLASRGRTVAEQLVHMNNVRLGWAHYHKTGKRPKIEGAKGTKATRAELIRMFKKSGKTVSEYLMLALNESAPLRAFKKNPIRWMSYLISHESHHRGSIMLALKQNKIKLPPKVGLEGLWGTWMWK